MNEYFACEVEDDANSSLEGEFEFARIMRLQVLPRAVSVYANQYFMEHENTVCDLFILFLSSFFLFLSSFFSSPNLSGRRLDVYHTLAHGVALVRI